MTAMLDAKDQCTHPDEEEGGVILDKDGEYLFVKLANEYKGTSRAGGLYKASDSELNDLVFSRVKDGWRLHSSFHTHPRFAAMPSSLDRDKLFEGFKYNVIYSIETNSFSYSEWVNDEILTCYLPVKTVKNAINQS